MQEKPTSGFWNLAHAIRAISPGSLFCMFTSYFDAAGGADYRFTVVSGYVATFAKWDRFEADWKILLANSGLAYFTMKQCAHWDGEFAGWNRDEYRRARFLSNAVEIISDNVMASIACVVDWNVYEEINKQYKLNEVFGHPYALAGRDCVAKANNTVIQANGIPGQLEYVFENGDQGKGHLIRVMEKSLGRIPMFKPSRDQLNKKTGILEKAVIPLQAADFAAYELRKAYHSDPLEKWLPERHRHSIQRLAIIPGEWVQYRSVDLAEICETAGVPKRIIR